jgi:hypothetical protein
MKAERWAFGALNALSILVGFRALVLHPEVGCHYPPPPALLAPWLEKEDGREVMKGHLRQGVLWSTIGNRAKIVVWKSWC